MPKSPKHPDHINNLKEVTVKKFHRIASIALAVLFILLAAMPAAAQDTPTTWPDGVQILGAPAKAYPAYYWSDGKHPDQRNDARNKGTPFGIILADPGERSANCALPDPDGVIAQVKKDRGDAITCVSPDTQGKLDDPVEYVEVPAGGYSLLTLGYGKANINGHTVVMPPKRGTTYHLYVKGTPGDGQIDTAEGNTIILTDHNPAHGLWNTFDDLGAFLSYEQALQEIANAHGRKNCGDKGCSYVVVIELDSVSGAFTVAVHQVGVGFTSIAKNW